MSSLRRRLNLALAERSRSHLGPSASPLDYVEAWLRQGATFADLARSLREDLGQPISRRFVSFVCHRLASDARERIVAAREQARTVRARAAPDRPSGAVCGSSRRSCPLDPTLERARPP